VDGVIIFLFGVLARMFLAVASAVLAFCGSEEGPDNQKESEPW
tara:strand:- start:1992 stop:2120 length:129 start_codon:yes stop_codon:yes gene_type:complete